MTKPKRPLTCKFCGCELYASTGTKMMTPMFRAADGHTTEGEYEVRNDGWCHNRDGMATYHHPDAPEYNGGIDYSDGRSLQRVVIGV